MGARALSTDVFLSKVNYLFRQGPFIFTANKKKKILFRHRLSALYTI